MIVIRTADELRRALSSPLNADLLSALQAQWDRLSEWPDYPLEELAAFLIVQQGDTAADAEHAYGQPLLSGDEFTWLPELVEQHSTWLEVTFILSDDGFGLVLLVEMEPATDPMLLTACAKAKAYIHHPSAE